MKGHKVLDDEKADLQKFKREFDANMYNFDDDTITETMPGKRTNFLVISFSVIFCLLMCAFFATFLVTQAYTSVLPPSFSRSTATLVTNSNSFLPIEEETKVFESASSALKSQDYPVLIGHESCDGFTLNVLSNCLKLTGITVETLRDSMKEVSSSSNIDFIHVKSLCDVPHESEINYKYHLFHLMQNPVINSIQAFYDQNEKGEMVDFADHLNALDSTKHNSLMRSIICKKEEGVKEADFHAAVSFLNERALFSVLNNEETNVNVLKRLFPSRSKQDIRKCIKTNLQKYAANQADILNKRKAGISVDNDNAYLKVFDSDFYDMRLYAEFLSKRKKQ